MFEVGIQSEWFALYLPKPEYLASNKFFLHTDTVNHLVFEFSDYQYFSNGNLLGLISFTTFITVHHGFLRESQLFLQIRIHEDKMESIFRPRKCEGRDDQNLL